MTFSSVTFLYFFLPSVLAIYYIVPDRLKNVILLLASLVFYFWGEPRFAVIMVFTALMGYGGGMLLGRIVRPRLRRAVMALSITLCLIPLLLFKYGDFLIANVRVLFQNDLPFLRLALPIGVSFYTFQVVSYVIDVYRKTVEPERNPFLFVMYVSLFPQLIAGPIVRFSDVQRHMRKRVVSLDSVASGIVRFVTGLGKKVLIANTLAELGRELGATPAPSVLSLWLTAFAFTFQIYFDFSGYSDMAIGMGKMFGFSFPENFRYPYLSKSVTEFWRRWHMTLGEWFRDYVYIPLGGSRGSWLTRVRNLLIVWLLTGLWHGAAWNFIAWGLFYFVVLSIERIGLSKVLEKLPSVLRVVYTFLLVMLGFVLFNADSLGEALNHLKGMFGLSSLPLVDHVSLYYGRSYAITLLIAVVASTPLIKTLSKRLSLRSMTARRAIDCAVIVGVIGMMTLVTAWLVRGSFNPFLYFRF
ncbi:MAG: MBOAT family O-acyltransferase [Saccharofermentanales bacterium]|jgi:alginate O-acetyltransferase complex protein AlgI